MSVGRNSYSVSGDIHNADIGAFCSIAGGVTVHGDDNHAWIYARNLISTFPFHEQWEIEGYPSSGGQRKTTVGNDVWICQSVSILPGLNIGDGAILGAHAVITKDVPPYAIVVGNPGKVVGYRFSKNQIKALLKIKWWELKDDIIKELIPYFQDVNKFIKYYEDNPDKFGAENRD